MKKVPVGVITASLIAVFLPSLPVAAQSTQDSVTGSGSAGGGTFSFNAVSGPSGEHATGSTSLDLAIGTFVGTVTCLNVVGNEATVGGVWTEGSTGAPVGDGYILHVRDGAGTGLPDLLRLELLGPGPPSSCGTVVMISPAPVESGDVSVVDAAAPEVTLETLLSSVEELALPTGVSTSLTRKLEAALAADGTGNVGAVCGLLRAFTSEVEAIAGRGLSVSEAENLVGDAESLQTELECAL